MVRSCSWGQATKFSHFALPKPGHRHAWPAYGPITAMMAGNGGVCVYKCDEPLHSVQTNTHNGVGVMSLLCTACKLTHTHTMHKAAHL